MYGQCITPVSKCCCSGTPYANAEQHGIIMPDNVTTTVDKHGVLHAFPASNAYSRLENVRPYLYEVWYDKLDYDAAYAWFSTKQPPVAAGACSSFRIGNFFARNFDWLYDRGAEFVVHTRCKDGRFATTGVASALPGMFDEVARDRMRTALFSYLPFTIVDGFNEAGVHISTNIVPNEKGNNNYVTPTGESLTTICTAMLPRFILDSFDSAQSAADWLGEHATMFPSKTLLAKGYHQHFLLADAEKTLVLEFVDGALVVMDAPGETVKGITNFHVSGVTFNADGTVYTPADVPTHTPTTENGITPHGMGLERWNIMAGFTGSDARDLLDALRYTKAYPTATASAIPAWLSEFTAGNRTVDSPASDFAHVLQVAGELYANRKRDGQTWQTVHASVYDMENQLLHLQVQEDTTTTYSFGLEGKCVTGGGECCPDELIRTAAQYSKVGSNVRIHIPLSVEHNKLYVPIDHDAVAALGFTSFSDSNSCILDLPYSPGELGTIGDNAVPFTIYIDNLTVAHRYVEESSPLDGYIAYYFGNKFVGYSPAVGAGYVPLKLSIGDTLIDTTLTFNYFAKTNVAEPFLLGLVSADAQSMINQETFLHAYRPYPESASIGTLGRGVQGVSLSGYFARGFHGPKLSITAIDVSYYYLITTNNLNPPN